MSPASRKLSDRQRRKLVERAIVKLEEARALLGEAAPTEQDGMIHHPLWLSARLGILDAQEWAASYAQAIYPNS